MTRRRLWIPLTIGMLILILGSIILSLQARDAVPPQVFSAIINRDCAPWDGSAFTITIPLQGAPSHSAISISIWQSPNIAFPASFNFPDESGQTGSAVYRSAPDTWEQLQGKVSFRRVQPGDPVEGFFSFSTKGGEIFEGRLVATWGDQIVYCG